MPRGMLSRELRRQLEPFAVVFLLPMFFVFSGLNTRLHLVGDASLLAGAAARWQGESQRTALAVGTLMNARGLMELIVVNIGLQHGLIRPALFSVLVLMAVVTTLMASPLFAWVYGRHAAGVAAPDAARSEA